MAPTDSDIAHFHGLIFKHALRVVDEVEMEFEDIVQTYRIKAWQALVSYDASRVIAPARRHQPRPTCRCARCKYVFMCLKNMEKDLLKRRRHFDVLIEGFAPGRERESFEQDYLSADHDEVYASVEDEGFTLPSTLDVLERSVIGRLYQDYSQAEARRDLGLSRAEMDRIMRQIRAKLEDWKPSSTEGGPLALVVEMPRARAHLVELNAA